MHSFMEKWIFGMVFAALIIFMGFWLAAFSVKAGEVTGSEGVFTHSHVESCYESVQVSCESKHTEDVRVEQMVSYCAACGGDTNQHKVVRTISCPIKGVSWQGKGYIACNVCCAYSSQWEQDLSYGHMYTEKRLKCNMAEGEATATLQIVAESGWTNKDVQLTSVINILKQDLSSENIATDWQGGIYMATANGSYTVTATNAQGNVISSTIQVSCIDKITPVINAVAGNEATMTDTEIEVSVSASDGESGLADVPYSLDGGVTWGNTATFRVEEGKPVSFAVRDKAGNISVCTIARSQFPYPPKVQAPAVSVPENPGSVGGLEPTPAPSAGKEAEESAGKEVAGKEVSEAKAKEKTVKDKTTEKNETKVEEQVSPVSVKRTLTREEKEQARGISVTLQKRARDAFFTKSRETKSSVQKQQAEPLENAIPAETVLREDAEVPLTSPKNSPESVKHSGQNMGTPIGIFLCVLAVGGLVYLLWLHTAVLYCYDGGEEYRKIGLFQIKRGKKELELYLPDYILQSTKAFRYRLMLKNRLVKRCQDRELVVYNEDNKLRQRVEECVDFVL